MNTSREILNIFWESIRKYMNDPQAIIWNHDRPSDFLYHKEDLHKVMKEVYSRLGRPIPKYNLNDTLNIILNRLLEN